MGRGRLAPPLPSGPSRNSRGKGKAGDGDGRLGESAAGELSRGCGALNAARQLLDEPWLSS